MSESADSSSSAPVVIDSPPASPQPVRPAPGDEARARLHRVAAELLRTRNRRLLVEFLTLRRAVR